MLSPRCCGVGLGLPQLWGGVLMMLGVHGVCFLLCFPVYPAGEVDTYLVSRGWSATTISQFLAAISPVDTWAGLNRLMQSNAHFFADLSEELPECNMDSLRADLALGSAPSAWKDGHFPSAVPRHSGLKRSTPGELGVARCAKTRAFFEVATDPVKLKTAIQALTDGMFALRTWASMDSQVKLYVGFCAKNDLTPFPVSVEALRGFCAAMKAASYRSVPQYVSGVFRYEGIMFARLDPIEVHAVRSAAKLFVKSATKDIGDETHRDPITAEHLFKMRDSTVIWSMKYKFYFMMAVVQFFFLLRSAEVLDIAPSHCVFRNLDKGLLVPAVRLLISSSKTNHRNRTIYRGHECTCGSVVHDLPICPVHALVWLRRASGLPFNSSEPFSLPGEGSGRRFIPTYASYLRFIHAVTTALGLAGLFATHSLRRGGCQALCLAGWTKEEIMIFGRWLSSVIEVYLLDAPLERAGLNMARSMLTRIRGGSGSAREFAEAPKLGQPFLGRPVGPREWAVGQSCQLYLPEAIPDRDDEDFGPSSAWCDMTVAALDPRPSQVPGDSMFHRSVRLSPDGLAFLPTIDRGASRIVAFLPGDSSSGWIVADVTEIATIR